MQQAILPGFGFEASKEGVKECGKLDGFGWPLAQLFGASSWFFNMNPLKGSPFHGGMTMVSPWHKLDFKN